MTDQTLIHIAQGPLRGAYDPASRLYRYLGIPYAEPPLGELRFRPPQPHHPWSEVRSAERFGPAAAQLFDETEGEYDEFSDSAPVPGRPWVGSEDCLTLNVWTRNPTASDKPVMVWIHGGANWLESSRLKCYHGDVLAANGDVVFVSLNYRLGLFGFLDVSVLGGEEFAGSHSHGLLDQLQALRWIRENIAQFGGDASNITLMGESAGSIDISWLLAGGHLQGLVQRVVMMSGYAGLPGLSGDLGHGLSDASAKELARGFFADCAIDSFAQLRELDTNALMTKVHALSERTDMLFHMDSLFWPKTHASAQLDPIEFARRGAATGIDILIGFTHYEMGLWLNWDDSLDRLGLDALVERLAIIPTALKDSAKALYRAQFPEDDDGVRAMHLLGDCAFVMPALWAAEGLAAQNRVQVYRFDRETDPRRRAQHAADQVYFFGKLDTYVGRLLAGTPQDAADAAESDRLSRLMQGMLLDYAGASQSPGDKLPQWPRYDAGQRTLLSLDQQPELLADPYAVRRQWWFENIYPAR
ncbi:carboxylesterase/lipase family protein [Pseudomonas sp. PDM23]|uniref:carboxylesterase/lipase family protein n=1 Tax=unclassified Pseudomonas TaxID=196821 RepID=UPI001785249F|nr:MULTISPECIES: carboxylesterase family protein [unclassified Pseudomonas]MBD9578918.1 carboxylesterase/lipase family protein [Pseudomonas sp. PDM23]MBD9674562.1 carboxylesterase/lipase family protein [Pseudomonas sp. PDM21]